MQSVPEKETMDAIAELFKGFADSTRVHILALGDVGSHILIGLRLLGGDCISQIGICDLNEQVAARWEFEANQIALPWNNDAMPEVEIVLTVTSLCL